MPGPLEGIRVIELGVVIAGPAAAGLLGDWGADVVKVEPPTGDPQRGNAETALFELDNRGKRSVCLDLKTPGGVELLIQLLSNADVFVTNLRLPALARLGLDHESLAKRFPALIYAAITGYGTSSDGADKAGYDVGAYWSRSGMALALTPDGTEPPVSRPGMGDHPTGMALAAGICAALVERNRTGRGQFVSTSLLRTGAYVIGSDLASRANGGHLEPGLRRMMFNPLLAVYRSADERWFWLLGLQATRHWPRITRAIGRPELVDDPRFSTMRALMTNRQEVLAVLDEAFTAQPMAYWADVFAREDVWWDPLLTFDEVLTDPLVASAGVFREVADSDDRAVAGPVDFSSLEPGPAPRAPEAGEHTEQILLDAGLDWDDITAAKDAGAIP
jgi:crotonobetainyl-CoA:carnitine CoA-transferase CaiB-like acyl-CoA transferase